MSESQLKIVCCVVILCWLPGIAGLGLASALAPVMSSAAAPVFVPLFGLASVISMLTMQLMVAAHLSVATLAVSFACLCTAIWRMVRRQSRWHTLALAATALVGHLSFLAYPRPPGTSWLGAVGLWPR